MGREKRAQQNNSFILSIRQHKNDVGTTMGCCVFFWVGCCCLFCFDMFSVSVCHILIAGEQKKSETDSLNVHKPRRRAQFWLSYHLEANCRRRVTTKNKKKINKLMSRILDAHTHTLPKHYDATANDSFEIAKFYFRISFSCSRFQSF